MRQHFFADPSIWVSLGILLAVCSGQTALAQLAGPPPNNQSAGAVMQSNMNRNPMMNQMVTRSMHSVVKLGDQNFDMMSGLDDSKKVFVKRIDLVGSIYLRSKELKPLFQPLEDREVTIGEIHTLCDSLNKMYQDKGHPLAYVYVPSQKMKEGRLRIVASEW